MSLVLSPSTCRHMRTTRKPISLATRKPSGDGTWLKDSVIPGSAVLSGCPARAGPGMGTPPPGPCCRRACSGWPPERRMPIAGRFWPLDGRRSEPSQSDQREPTPPPRELRGTKSGLHHQIISSMGTGTTGIQRKEERLAGRPAPGHSLRTAIASGSGEIGYTSSVVHPSLLAIRNIPRSASAAQR